MNKIPSKYLYLLLGVSLTAESTDWLEFDADPKIPEEIYREAVNSGIAIRCELKITELRPLRYDFPAVNLWLSKSGELPIEGIDDQVVQLSVLRPPDSSNYIYVLSTLGIGRNYDSGLHRFDAGKEVREFTLVWPNDGTLKYYVGPDEADTAIDNDTGVYADSRIDYHSKFEPRFWILTATGAAGRIRCESRDL